MTSTPDLYDANLPSDGLTIDTSAGPVDMVAVLRRLNREKVLRLTRAELDMVAAVRKRYAYLVRTHGRPAVSRAEMYRRLARTLTGAA